MPNLYSRLFRYRPRTNRTPLEDFLTEALADLLNRLPSAVAQQFVVEVLLRPDQISAFGLDYLGEDALTWSTQVQITTPRRGILDLLAVGADGQPLIVVESKIGSGIRSHIVPTQAPRSSGLTLQNSTEQDADTQTQLTTYRAWLAGERQGLITPGAIVFLTHATVPPAEYLASPVSLDNGPLRSTCSWRDVARWLINTGAQVNLDVRSGWVDLAFELASFLTENDMNSDPMRFHDLAALHLYVESARRIETTFELIAKASTDLIKVSTGFSGPQADTEGGLYWAWVYPKPPYAPAGAKWYVGWGLRFPESSTWWNKAEPELPTAVQAFVHIGSDAQRAPLPLLSATVPEGWSRTDADLVIAKPLSDFTGKSDAVVNALGRWIAKMAQQALILSREMVELAGSQMRD